MSPGLSFLVLTSLFLTVAALERVPAFQFRPSRLFRPFVATDAAWYLVATTANLISTFVFRPQLTKLAIPVVADSIVGLPFVVRVVAAVVVYDFVAFAVHVGIHRSDKLWSVHKVHHSSLQLDGLATTRTHMFEHLLRNVPAQATLFALGMSASTVGTTLVIYAAGCITCRPRRRTTSARSSPSGIGCSTVSCHATPVRPSEPGCPERSTNIPNGSCRPSADR